jgi:hypothetical protein
MPCSSLTGLNSQTPSAVRPSSSPVHSRPSFHRVPLCKVRRAAKVVRLLSGRVHPSLGGSVLSVSPLPVSPFTDSEWTKEETDYLFRIVHEYDLRWYVIHDRYDYPDGPVRAIEVPCPHAPSIHALTSQSGPQGPLLQRLSQAHQEQTMGRGRAGQVPASQQLPVRQRYILTCQSPQRISRKPNPEREMMRKNYIASLEDRTPDEIAEEEALFVELKRLEQNERKFRKERDDLLRTLLGVDSGLPGIVVEEDGPSALSVEGTKKKKKGTALDFELPPTPSNIIQLGPPVTKRAPPPKSAVYGETEALTQRLQLIRLQTRNTALFASNPP